MNVELSKITVRNYKNKYDFDINFKKEEDPSGEATIYKKFLYSNSFINNNNIIEIFEFVSLMGVLNSETSFENYSDIRDTTFSLEFFKDGSFYLYTVDIRDSMISKQFLIKDKKPLKISTKPEVIYNQDLKEFLVSVEYYDFNNDVTRTNLVKEYVLRCVYDKVFFQKILANYEFILDDEYDLYKLHCNEPEEFIYFTDLTYNFNVDISKDFTSKFVQDAFLVSCILEDSPKVKIISNFPSTLMRKINYVAGVIDNHNNQFITSIVTSFNVLDSTFFLNELENTNEIVSHV